ncbi:hypothetical protein FE257_004786 [Aspergillus nanangensis]|uniref:Zn(2)-C6 fungal-type domain-containing protein n=1 Tax=Aspergillus nanangensis TaxID=2582783 RepID=A0AAD4GVV3_ASPNN|nr:hypothetical protein FE257_004786 [Aspergillus nanangensis]
MGSRYRIRFAAVAQFAEPTLGKKKKLDAQQQPPVQPQPPNRARSSRSRYGCEECRQSRVKCDETFPICGRCTRRGVVCHAATRESQWQLHLPPSSSIKDDDEPLLHHWFSTTSQIIVSTSADDNPFSYPIAQYISPTGSLIHTLKSISAAHQNFFKPRGLQRCLEERCKALRAFRQELVRGEQSLQCSFLTAYLLGISSSYLDRYGVDYGKDHLLAAHAIVGLILADDTARNHPLTHLIVGAFVYWDMSCAFLVDTPEQREIGTPLLDGYITDTMQQVFHPITGRCTGLFYILCRLGRYVRRVSETADHNSVLELQFERELLEWDDETKEDPMWTQTSHAFRSHGLIMLYRFCGRSSNYPGSPLPAYTTEGCFTTDDLVRNHAVTTISSLLCIPLASRHLCLQPIPLLTAGAELTSDDACLRQEVRSRFKALYSFNRIPAHLAAEELLVSLWELKDSGQDITWLELMLLKGWRLRVG